MGLTPTFQPKIKLKDLSTSLGGTIRPSLNLPGSLFPIISRTTLLMSRLLLSAIYLKYAVMIWSISPRNYPKSSAVVAKFFFARRFARWFICWTSIISKKFRSMRINILYMKIRGISNCNFD